VYVWNRYPFRNVLFPITKITFLEIEKLVDLANSKLMARYSGALESKGSAPPAVRIVPPTAVTDKWSDENWVAKKLTFNYILIHFTVIISYFIGLHYPLCLVALMPGLRTTPNISLIPIIRWF
jgi:hypothetical protein